MAIRLCAFLNTNMTIKPLFISIYGPPGVGKSKLHRSLAELLYLVSQSKSASFLHSGEHCPSYKTFQIPNIFNNEKEIQVYLLQRSIIDHIKNHPKSLIMIEKFNEIELTCRLLNQLIFGGAVVKFSPNSSIVILETTIELQKIAEMSESIRALARKRQDHFFTEIPKNVCLSFELVERIFKDQYLTKLNSLVNEPSNSPDEKDIFFNNISLVNSIDIHMPFLPLRKKEKYLESNFFFTATFGNFDCQTPRDI